MNKSVRSMDEFLQTNIYEFRLNHQILGKSKVFSNMIMQVPFSRPASCSHLHSHYWFDWACSWLLWTQHTPVYDWSNSALSFSTMQPILAYRRRPQASSVWLLIRDPPSISGGQLESVFAGPNCSGYANPGRNVYVLPFMCSIALRMVVPTHSPSLWTHESVIELVAGFAVSFCQKCRVFGMAQLCHSSPSPSFGGGATVIHFKIDVCFRLLLKHWPDCFDTGGF